MTWGSNATFRTGWCRYCGIACVDDTDDGPSHELTCGQRPWWRRLRSLIERGTDWLMGV